MWKMQRQGKRTQGAKVLGLSQSEQTGRKSESESQARYVWMMQDSCLGVTMQLSQTLTLHSKQKRLVTLRLGHLQRPIFGFGFVG